MNANLRFLVMGCAVGAVVAGRVGAQQNLESAFRTTGVEVVAVYEEQRAVLQTSSAVIQKGREQLSYGVVYSADGLILTKASEIEEVELGELSVLVDRKSFSGVELVGVDAVWDVAVLKVDAANLVPVVFFDGDAGELPYGTMVVANGATSRFARRALGGVVSAKAREIPTAGGVVMGVTLKARDEEKGLLVEGIVEGGGAEKAGLAVGDVVMAVNGVEVSAVEEIAEQMSELKPGEDVEVRYVREGNEVVVRVPLVAREELFGEEMMTRNDQMSGDFSKRRSGFPRVIQHDIMGNSSSMGGPVLNREGRFVGMNIARANRAETFAIPAGEVSRIVERLLGREE